MNSYDYSPVSDEEKHFYKMLDQLYAYQKEMYSLYGRMRFRGAAFMKDPTPDLALLGEESVAEHLFSSVMFWEILERQLAISHLIDRQTVRQMILLHDLGEIKEGDISAVLQLQGIGRDRRETEDKAFASLVTLLPQPSQSKLLTINHRYETEKNNPETTDKETLMAKIMDMFQGDHYVLTYGTDMSTHIEIHTKIVSTKLLPYALRLITVLKNENHPEAAEEIYSLMRHHLYQYQLRD